MIKSDIRIGTIVKVEEFPEARKPAYKVWVDLGPELGIKKSSAQITKLYVLDELIGKQVVCVCDLEPRQIGPFMSEILVTGFETENGVVLTEVNQQVPNGTKLS